MCDLMTGYFMGGLSHYSGLESQPGAGELAARQAWHLYDQARRRSLIHAMVCLVRRRGRRLLKLASLETACTIGSRWDEGVRTVALDAIQGSEGRCMDFDSAFFPTARLGRSRWIRVAAAHLQGVVMPPVELIRVGEVFFVRDGHHRISVARALGQEYIEAHVLVWQVAQALAYEGVCAVSQRRHASA